MGGNDHSTAWEDIHILSSQSGGQNLGWPLCEGLACTTASFDRPVYAYPHKGGAACIIGGPLYRGKVGWLPAAGSRHQAAGSKKQAYAFTTSIGRSPLTHLNHTTFHTAIPVSKIFWAQSLPFSVGHWHGCILFLQMFKELQGAYVFADYMQGWIKVANIYIIRAMHTCVFNMSWLKFAVGTNRLPNYRPEAAKVLIIPHVSISHSLTILRLIGSTCPSMATPTTQAGSR